MWQHGYQQDRRTHILITMITLKGSIMTKTQKKFLQDAITKQMGAKPVEVLIPNKGIYIVPLNAKSATKVQDPKFVAENAEKILKNKIRKKYQFTDKDTVVVSDSAAEIRAWAEEKGLIEKGKRGRLSRDTVKRYRAAHNK